jgi:hypothetical protein
METACHNEAQTHFTDIQDVMLYMNGTLKLSYEI